MYAHPIYARAHSLQRAPASPVAARSGFMSEIGEAVARLPPRHATLRICAARKRRERRARVRTGWGRACVRAC
eukprot:4857874-Pleurochrysis_carterae.AAC.1